LNDFILNRIAQQPRSFLAQLAIALACVLVATGLRFALTPAVGGVAIPYITFFPAIMVAAVAGGLRSGVICLAGSFGIAALLFVEPIGGLPVRAPEWAGLIAFLVSGALILWLCHLLSATVRDLAAAHRQERLLVLELQHRVKNTLAVVQALAVQTFAAVGDFRGFKDAFTDRLVALGRAHNLLSQAAWSEVSLETLIRATVEPFLGPERQRLSTTGDSLALPADLVVDLALCLHELATNATKHGALSHADGRVTVEWRRLGADRVELQWRERDGPAVAPPSRRGFGSRLLERGLSRRVRPQVAMSFEPTGLVWTAEFDIT
jgi:two-component sensor histidine kinase